MKKRYEALLALDTRGKEESIKDIIDRLEKEFKAEGAEIEQIQRLERREFSYEHDHQKGAYYVNIIFEADPAVIDKLRSKLRLDEEVSLQNYLLLPAKKKTAEPAA
jgi:small subunit ribosomal protein S6